MVAFGVNKCYLWNPELVESKSQQIFNNCSMIRVSILFLPENAQPVPGDTKYFIFLNYGCSNPKHFKTKSLIVNGCILEYTEDSGLSFLRENRVKLPQLLTEKNLSLEFIQKCKQLLVHDANISSQQTLPQQVL